MSLLALVLPVLAMLLVVVIGVFIGVRAWKKFHPAQA